MVSKSLFFLGLLVLMFSGGCASYRTTADWPDSFSTEPDVASTFSDTTRTAIPELAGPLTYPEALALALRHNPGLGAVVMEVHAAEARTRQAALYPNPEIGTEVENFAGSGPFSGIGGVETTVAISQPLLLGGKRGKAIRRAALQSDLATWEVARRRLDVRAEVHNAFNMLLIAQEDVVLKEELVELAERLLETTEQRVQAGKVSAAETARARVIVAQNRIALEQARRAKSDARTRLVAAWGGVKASFGKVQGDHTTLFELPPEDSLRIRLEGNPDLGRFETAIRDRRAAIDVEDAMAIPDPTVSGGVRRLEESGDVAFLVGLSIPLPLSDRNQGNRQAARHDLTRVKREAEAVRIDLERRLTHACSRMEAARMEARILDAEVIPQAESAYHRINQGYLQGRFDFLDVLDAQRTLFESRDRYLHALREYHETVVAIERLIARPVH